MSRTRPGRGRPAATAAVLLAAAALPLALALVGAPAARAAAGWGEVARLYRLARYDEAQVVAAGLDGASADGLYWRFRLASEPAHAFLLAREIAARDDVPAARRAFVALEAGAMRLARGEPEAALESFEAARRLRGPGRSGKAALLRALALHAAGRQDSAREALAAIGSGDPSHLDARALEARWELAAGDPAAAWRVCEASLAEARARGEPALLTAAAAALAALDRAPEAAVLRTEVTATYPGAQTGELLRGPDAAARPVPGGPPRATPAVPPASRDLPAAQTGPAGRPAAKAEASRELPAVPPGTGPGGPAPRSAAAAVRYTLQLGAFAEMSRARAFLDRWLPALPDLRLVRENGAQGAALWKVRLGDFADRTDAQARVERLRRVQGLEALIVEIRPRAEAAR